MAKKFFHDHVYNTKRTIINISIIGICVIGIIICFIVTSNFQGESKNNPSNAGGILNLNSETTIEVNESYTNEIFFAKIENVNINDIKITYPDNFDISKPGEYQISITVGDETKTTKLIIVDTIMPELTVREVTIKENASYSAKDFVTSCFDNSKHDCKIAFAKDSINQDGDSVNYATYKKAGIYAIKISAKDDSGNENIKETKLIITANASVPPETEVTECKYGNNEYNSDVYVLAVDKTSNGCAVSLDLYMDKNMTAEVDKMMETESTRIKKDVNALKLDGMLSLNRRRTAVLNNAGTGVVGYQLRMTVTIKKGEEIKTIADYKLDSNGKRIFISNDYNLSS